MTIDCEAPNELLYEFDGNIKLKSGEVMPLSVDSFLLKGSSLQRTEWVYGVAVYTGHESKLMKNSSSARSKKSDVEKKTDRYILITAGI